MKLTKLFSLGFLALFAWLPLSSMGKSNDNKVTKHFQTEYQIDPETRVSIENRYGQLNIENWDKDMIAIEVDVVVEHMNKKKAENILSAITVNFGVKGNDITALTEIEEKMMKNTRGNSFSWFSNNKIQIDYRVKVPSNINISLTNKYGDIFIDRLTAHTTINLKYGNLKANCICSGSSENISLVRLKYSNASIEEANWMMFEMEYANVNVDRATALVLSSKYSKFNAERVSSLVNESKYGTINIGRIGNLVGESGYTTYRINQLDRKLEITTKYGDVHIDEVNPKFQYIVFNGSYAGLRAPIAHTVSYTLDGQAAYGGITYGSPARVSRIDSINKLTVNGTVGENPNPTQKVTIRVKYGNVNLR